MIGPIVDLAAAIVATMLVMLLPGALLVSCLRAGRLVPALLLPATAVCGSVLLAAPVLVLTLSMHWSIRGLAVAYGLLTVALAVVALLRWSPDPARSWRERVRRSVPYAAPSAILFVLGIFDAPQVRSDTYWHVALARKLAELDSLSSARIAFEAGSAGNANYPLPAWHALIALADQVPRVDVWSATWFCTLWLGPVAMLAFGAMAAALVGDRRAGLVGCWTFAAVVVLGYGPWFFATRYLSYPGQVAIFVLLPIVVWAIVHAIGARSGERAATLTMAAVATATIGVLHGNYVLYPALVAGGGAVLLLLGNRERVGAALLATAVVVTSGALALAAQLPWIRNDDNFLRGAAAPAGEPTAFIRHRDVFVGSSSSFHVELGSLATQPWLVVGALALPVLVWLGRRFPGPWVVAGGAVAMVVFARTPQLVDLLDRAGSITPVTRLDRIYPAAVGVVATMLGIGWLLAAAFGRGRRTGIALTGTTMIAIAGLTWWVDSIRDTRRIVVTPFVEARWVGGLDPSGLPRVAVYVATIATIVVAIVIRARVRSRALQPAALETSGSPRHSLAVAAAIAVVVGLAPASVDRAHATWTPQAYDRGARRDADFVRIEVYPAPVRRVVERFRPGSTVLASFDETRKIAALAPVQSVEESELRELERAAPATSGEFVAWAGWGGGSDDIRIPRDIDYVVVPAGDASFEGVIDYATECGWLDRSRGGLRIFERRGDRCAPAQVDEPQP